MVKVSVIVPVYNVEKFINRCVDSILSQTFKDFELILVNDGSKDKSLEIIGDNLIEDCENEVIIYAEYIDSIKINIGGM